MKFPPVGRKSSGLSLKMTRFLNSIASLEREISIIDHTISPRNTKISYRHMKRRKSPDLTYETTSYLVFISVYSSRNKCYLINVHTIRCLIAQLAEFAGVRG